MPQRYRKLDTNLEFLLKESNKLNATFVNWWVPRDLDALWEIMKENGADPALSSWNSCGLVDAQGKPRQGLKIWKSWLNKPLKNRHNKAIQPTGYAGS